MQREALEHVWQSHLDGRLSMAEAVEQLLDTLQAEPR
jgi:hypothetical protein